MLDGINLEDVFPIVIFFGILGMILIVAFIANRLEKKRMEAIRNYCVQNGLSYSESAKNVPSIARNFSLYVEKGHTNRWQTEMAGKRGEYSFCIFEHFYVVGYGKNRHSHIDTICVISKDELNMPQFFVREESLIFDTLGKLFGGQDINFTEDPVFSRKFVLQGMSEPSIRQFFDKKVRAVFVNKHVSGYRYEGYLNCFATCISRSLNINERLAMLSNTMNIFNVLISKQDQDYLG